MITSFHPSFTELDQTFAEEIAALGGHVSDRFADESRLLLRAVLPRVTDVTPGDPVQAGVALRAADQGIAVHPYILRHVCVNGAIAATALDTHRIRRVEFETATEFVVAALEEVRVAVRRAAAPQALENAADRMRSYTTMQADVMINMIPILARVPRQFRPRMLQMIRERFDEDGDSSMFGLMNAVTSVARDTTDPDLRWTLEGIGGALITHGPTRPHLPSAVEALALA
jgi:hypothetical protein